VLTAAGDGGKRDHENAAIGKPSKKPPVEVKTNWRANNGFQALQQRDFASITGNLI
jgi:hypothetical protein